jgi:hypothetical protein
MSHISPMEFEFVNTSETLFVKFLGVLFDPMLDFRANIEENFRISYIFCEPSLMHSHIGSSIQTWCSAPLSAINN